MHILFHECSAYQWHKFELRNAFREIGIPMNIKYSRGMKRVWSSIQMNASFKIPSKKLFKCITLSWGWRSADLLNINVSFLFQSYETNLYGMHIGIIIS